MSNRINQIRRQIFAVTLFVCLSTLAISWTYSEIGASANDTNVPTLVDGHQGGIGHG